MVIAIVAFSVLAGIHLSVIKKDWMNPGTIFLWYWALVVLMASLRLFGLMETSNEAYLFVLIGVVFYYLGSYIAGRIRIKLVVGKSAGKRTQQFDCYETNYSFLYIAAIIVIIYSIYRIILIIQLLSAGNSWWAIRLMATSGEGGAGTLKGGNLNDIIYSFIVSPLIYLIVPTVVTEVLSGKKRKIPIILSVVATLTYSIATVSRAVWAFAIIYIVAIALLFRKRFTLSKRQKRILRMAPLIIIVLALIINKITTMRNSEADIFVNAYAYFSGCMPLLSVHLKEIISNTRTYGMLTLYGFLNPIFFLMNRLHILSYPVAFKNAKLVKDNLEAFIALSPSINMNAYATLFYDFYIDFGMIGIALGSFIFGFICMKAFNSYKRKGDTRSLVIYLILLQFILFSVARIYTIYATRALSFIWIIPMFKKSVIKNSKNKEAIGVGKRTKD